MLLLLLLFAILRHEREVIANVLLASGNSIHSSSNESEHADDYDDDEEEDDERQERNLPDATKIYYDNDFLCHNMPVTLYSILSYSAGRDDDLITESFGRWKILHRLPICLAICFK